MSGRQQLPALPKSWSELSWQQLSDCWQAKMRYGSNPDVARAAALLSLYRLEPCRNKEVVGRYDGSTGEAVYALHDTDGCLWTVTPRELSQMAGKMTWFDYPYGDPGKPAVKDEKGMVIEEAVSPVHGYVSNMRDAMILPVSETEVGGVLFALPQAACANLTWEQYRALQQIAPQLFTEGLTDEQMVDMHAQFLAHCLVAAQDPAPSNDRFAAKYVFKYDSLRAERTVGFWKVQLPSCPSLFHICFQTYQTAIGYYAAVYPLLFEGGGKQDTLKDALTGEAATIDAVMMKANYSSQQEVYDTNLPFILDILNSMAKEAKEIENMNAKIKNRRR